MNKLKNKFLFILFFFLGYSNLFSEYYPINQLSVLGKSVNSVGLGGSAYGLNSVGEEAIDNIALSSLFLRNDFFINTGIYQNNFHDLNIGYYHPSTIGIFSGFYYHFVNQVDEIYFYSLGGGFAKQIIEELLFGFKLNFNYYQNKHLDDIALGITGDLNFIYKSLFKATSNFFVFEDFVLGLGLRNVGFVPKLNLEMGDVELQQMDFIRMGIGFDFINFYFSQKVNQWKSRLLVDAALISFPLREEINLGWKNSLLFPKSILREFYISTGYYYNPNLNSTLPITLGTGLEFFFENLELDFNYAIVLSDSNPDSFFHKFSLNLKFGEIDDASPEIDTSDFSLKGRIEEGSIE